MILKVFISENELTWNHIYGNECLQAIYLIHRANLLNGAIAL